jgi:Na+-translocating ferredoxin:NAD+ oxidoreductase RnfA subunit
MQLFFSWVAVHWQIVCGWVTGLYILYRVGRVFTGLISFMASASSRVKNSEDTLQGVASTLSLVVGNHLPHIQTELENVNKTLLGMRGDFRAVLAEKFATGY